MLFSLCESSPAISMIYLSFYEAKSIIGKGLGNWMVLIEDQSFFHMYELS